MNKRQRARYVTWLKKGILAECVLVLTLAAVVAGRQGGPWDRETAGNKVLSIEDDYIKWVDFTVSYDALCTAYEWDVKTHGTEHEICWVELLAYTAAKTGGKFDSSALKTMNKAAKKLSEGETTLEELTADMKYYEYYREAYDAAIGGLVGEYRREVTGNAVAGTESAESRGAGVESAGSGVAEIEGMKGGEAGIGEKEGTAAEPGESGDSVQYETVYGLKGYFPLARGFDYTHYDDFGAGRSYGYKRKHLGHDMMGLVGTPIRI